MKLHLLLQLVGIASIVTGLSIFTLNRLLAVHERYWQAKLSPRAAYFVRPASAAKPAAAKPAVKPKPAVQTDDQRFEAANTTHDGKLTKDQATKAKWRTVTRAFTAIDKDKKGYVTLEDIKAYNASKKPAKPAAAKPAAAPKP